MKLIKLEGVAKEIVVKDCIHCPFFDSRGHICETDIKSCPLPDCVDENEHAAPDGTVLVAVEDACANCYYNKISRSKGCGKEPRSYPCTADRRRDCRNIAWVPKSEVK